MGNKKHISNQSEYGYFSHEIFLVKYVQKFKPIEAIAVIKLL